MRNRRSFLGLTASVATLAWTLTCTLAWTPVLAQEAARFTADAFAAAQAANRPILVEVTAPWCPTCKAQAPIVNFILSDPQFKDMVRFAVDYDSMKETLRSLKVQKQSTLVVFKGRTEVGRSTGDTSPNGIEDLIRKAI